MFVFVQNASKSIASSDVEPGNLGWVGDRGGQWMQPRQRRLTRDRGGVPVELPSGDVSDLLRGRGQ